MNALDYFLTQQEVSIMQFNICNFRTTHTSFEWLAFVDSGESLIECKEEIRSNIVKSFGSVVADASYRFQDKGNGALLVSMML